MQYESVVKEFKCQNSCLILIRYLLLHIAVFRTILSFIPIKQMFVIIVYLTGLIMCNQINAVSISEKIGFVSHDKITRMLVAKWWTTDLMLRAVISLVNMLGEGWLILDDTLIPKNYAKLIAFCNWDWDHSEKRDSFGIRLVVVVWSNGLITIPLGFYIWQKEAKKDKPKKKKNVKKLGRPKKRGRKIKLNTKEAKQNRSQYCDKKKVNDKKPKLNINGGRYFTKNELARELVRLIVVEKINTRVFLFDNWYASKENLEFFSKLKLEWVTRIKSNQNVIYQGKKSQVKLVANSVPKKNYHHYDSFNARIRSFEIQLHLRSVKLTVIKDDPHQEQDRTKYLITSNLKLTNREVVEWYRKRWAIETFFRDTKHLLGLSKSQVREAKAVLNHIVLVFMAYIVLQLFKPVSEKAVLSISQSKKVLNSLKLLVLPGRSIQYMVSQNAHGDFEIVDIDNIMRPVRTKLLGNYIPEHVIIPVQK